MVDLVKIRKKAKKKEEAAAAAEPPAAEPQPPAPASQSAPQSPPPAAPDPRADESSPAPQPAAEDLAPHAVSKLERFKEEAGRRRDVERRDEIVSSDGAQLELLTFSIAGEQYAIDIEQIVEIVTPRDITRVPNAEQSIAGIISLRGTIVTIIGVRARLRHPAAPAATPDTRIIVVSHRGETLGFEVDRVSRVVKIAPESVEPHPVVHASEQSDAIRGVFRHANALTILLDLDKLLDAQTPA